MYNFPFSLIYTFDRGGALHMFSKERYPILNFLARHWFWVYQTSKKNTCLIIFPVRLRNRRIRNGSQPYWKIMYSIELQKFSTNMKIKKKKLILILLAQIFGHLGLNKTNLILSIFNFNIHGKLSMIRCDK